MKNDKSDNNSIYCILNHDNWEEECMRIVLAYVNYYNSRAKMYKYAYRILSVTKYIALAVIPIVQVIPSINKVPWIAVAASSLCILLDSIINLFGMKEKWILYRNSHSKLMSEQRQYASRCGKYYGFTDDARFSLFVKNLEEIYMGESAEWNETVNRETPQQSFCGGNSSQ